MAYGTGYAGGYADPSGVLLSLLIETEPDDWYDASADLISGEINRGRERELDKYRAGRCRVELSNDTRTYDPSNPASPLDGYIVPMKRVQLVSTYGGDTYPLFTGFADRWTQNRVGPHRGTTTLQATDALKVLARANLATSVYAHEVATDGPVAWWRLDEQGGTVAHDQIGAVDLAARGTPPPSLGGTSLVARDPGGAASFEVDSGFTREGQMPLAGGPLTIEAVVRSETSTSDNLIAGQATHFAGTGAVLSFDTGSGFGVATTPGVAAVTQISGSDPAGDGSVHHVVGVWNNDGSLKIYIDGADRTVGTPSVAIGAFSGTAGFTIVGAFDEDSTTGAIDEVAFYDYALTPARIVAHAAAVTTPWDGDTADERIDRILDAIGWTGGRDLDVSATTLQSAELNMAALEHIQKVADSEFGNVYVTAAGDIRFENRDSLVNQPTVASFSDAAGTDLPVTFSEPEISDELIRNDVTVSRLEGSAQRVQDQDSIDAYQIASYTRDGLYHDDDALSRNAAEFFLSEYAQPVERVNSLAVNPYADTALWPAILALELTDRVELEETLNNYGDPVTRTLVVEGIQHTFGPKTWEATFALSPAYAGDNVPFFQWDVTRWDEHRWYF